MRRSTMTPGRILLILAVVCFVLAALNVTLLGTIGLIPLGLAFLAASFLI